MYLRCESASVASHLCGESAPRWGEAGTRTDTSALCRGAMRPGLSRMNEGINRGTGIDQREWKGGGVEGEKRSHRVIDGSPTVSGIYTPWPSAYAANLSLQSEMKHMKRTIGTFVANGTRRSYCSIGQGMRNKTTASSRRTTSSWAICQAEDKSRTYLCTYRFT